MAFNIRNILGLESSDDDSTIILSSDDENTRSISPIGTITLSSDGELDVEEVRVLKIFSTELFWSI